MTITRTTDKALTTMWTVMTSPIGDLRVIANDAAILAIEFSPFRGLADGRPGRGTG